MSIVLRSVKGSELTIVEMDNNFSELQSRIAEKANSSHTHTIANVTGLQDALDDKIDLADTNVPNGLLVLDSTGKTPLALTNANKWTRVVVDNHETLGDENVVVFREPGGGIEEFTIPNVASAGRELWLRNETSTTINILTTSYIDIEMTPRNVIVGQTMIHLIFVNNQWLQF